MAGILKSKIWVDAVDKENRLRLSWFRKNEERLTASAEAPNARTVPQNLLDEAKEHRQNNYKNKEKHPYVRVDDAPPPKFDERAMYNIMKPMEPEVREILFRAIDRNGGRVRYLKERVKTKPDDRYYFPETSSYAYGWNMWEEVKHRVNLGHGRQQVVKASFYRRRGVERDPDWYKEPARLTPLVCGRL